MNLLCVDTSTRRFSLAVKSGGKILRHKNITINKILESSMIPAIHRILDESEIPLKKLDALAIGLGPGSFTSLRVGLATTKGLAFAAGKPLVGIPSADVLAQGCLKIGPSRICTVSDAKRNLVYGCLFEAKNGKLSRKSDYLLTGIKELLTRVKGETVFAGDGVDLYKEIIAAESKRWKFQPVWAGKKFEFPNAKDLADLAEPAAVRGKFVAPEKMVPLYLYADDCQVVSSKKL